MAVLFRINLAKNTKKKTLEYWAIKLKIYEILCDEKQLAVLL